MRAQVPPHPLVGGVAGLAAVAITSLLLAAVDADQTAAALVLVAVGVLLTLLGPVAAVIAIVASFVSLNFFFMAPKGAFGIQKVDDLVALATLGITTGVLGLTMARANRLRRQADRNEREARDAEIEAAVEAGRAAFLAAMTHNLRTPLATIKVAVSTLLATPRQPYDGDGTMLLRTAYEESDRLERLVDKVLALSRIRTGGIVVDLETIDIAEVAQAAVQRVRIMARDRPVAFDAPPELLLARVDTELLEVVLVNLLENALRYAPDGGVLIAGRHEDGRVVLTVEDEGPGIAPEDRARAFEEFVRLGTGGDTSGTGIGLTIARELVVAQRGTIMLGERPGGGTRVTMTFESPR